MKKHGNFLTGRSVGIFRENVLPWENRLRKEEMKKLQSLGPAIFSFLLQTCPVTLKSVFKKKKKILVTF